MNTATEMHSQQHLLQLWNRNRVNKHDIIDVPLELEGMHPRQMVWHLYYNNMTIPTCQHESCSNAVKWNQNNPQQLENNGQYNHFCSQQCGASAVVSMQKRKKTTLQKYGSEHVLQNKTVREKAKKTMTEIYGVNSYSQTQEFKDKFKKTMNERYGVDYAMQSTDIHDKSKNTCLKKYGVDNPAKTKLVKEKKQQTCQDRYGTDSYTQTVEFDKKSKHTCMEKYGVEQFMSASTFQSARKATMIEKYGVVHALQNDELKQKAIDTSFEKYGELYSRHHIAKDTLDILDNKNMFVKFASGKNVTQIAHELNVNYVTIMNRVVEYDCNDVIDMKYSYLECEMRTFLNEYNIKFKENDRSVLSGKELDFYLPTHNLAIEMNGDYWHSDRIRPDKKYHYNKWKICADNNIHLIQISESDWNNNNLKFKDMLLRLLHVNKLPIIGARKFNITAITGKTACEFHDNFHLQGRSAAKFHYGAFDQYNILRGVMSFGYTRGSKQTRRFELKRWVTDTNASYPGLFSKILKYAYHQIKFDQVVSFSMNDWFTGNVYKQAGFIKGKTLTPAYKYLYNKELRHCSAFTKQNIRTKFNTNTEIIDMLDSGCTEFQIMDYLNIPRIWDSGKTEWIWKK